MYTVEQGWKWYGELTAEISGLVRWLSVLAIPVGLAAGASRLCVCGWCIVTMLDVSQKALRAAGFRASALNGEEMGSEEVSMGRWAAYSEVAFVAKVFVFVATLMWLIVAVSQ
jgi:hypothetical protein